MACLEPPHLEARRDIDAGQVSPANRHRLMETLRASGDMGTHGLVDATLPKSNARVVSLVFGDSRGRGVFCLIASYWAMREVRHQIGSPEALALGWASWK